MLGWLWFDAPGAGLWVLLTKGTDEAWIMSPDGVLQLAYSAAPNQITGGVRFQLANSSNWQIFTETNAGIVVAEPASDVVIEDLADFDGAFGTSYFVSNGVALIRRTFPQGQSGISGSPSWTAVLGIPANPGELFCNNASMPEAATEFLLHVPAGFLIGISTSTYKFGYEVRDGGGISTYYYTINGLTHNGTYATISVTHQSTSTAVGGAGPLLANFVGPNYVRAYAPDGTFTEYFGTNIEPIPPADPGSVAAPFYSPNPGPGTTTRYTEGSNSIRDESNAHAISENFDQYYYLNGSNGHISLLSNPDGITARQFVRYAHPDLWLLERSLSVAAGINNATLIKATVDPSTRTLTKDSEQPVTYYLPPDWPADWIASDFYYVP